MEGCEQYISKDGETTIYTRDGKVVAKCVKNAGREEWRNASGKKHRDGGLPAVICYENGQKTSEFWYRDGKCHLDGDMPAVIHYGNGQITALEWYRDGKLHRDGLPSVIYYKNGQKTKESWHRDGRYHRDGLPAVIYYENGQKTREQWYRGGVEYIPEKPKVDPVTEQLAIIETAIAKIREEIAKK